MAIKIESGLLCYPVLNEKDEQITTLVIDKNDATIIDRLSHLVAKSEEISQALEALKGKDGQSMTMDEMAKAMEEYNRAAEMMVDETEKIFGEGIVHDIYARNYELNPGFVPTVEALSNIYDEFIPIIEEIFKVEKGAPKYSPVKKGARTPKTRKEVIAQLNE